MSDDEATELPRRDRPNRRNPADIDPELATNIYRNKKGGHSRDGLNEKLIGWDDRNRPGGHPDPDDEDEDRTVDENHDVEDELRKSTLNDLVTSEFYNRENWFEEMCEVLFKIKGRGTTIKAELYFGVIHFISCFYCIAVVPQILSDSKYDPKATAVAVSLCSGIGSIFCGLFANLPFVLAPPTVVSIFLAGFNEQNGIGPAVGNYGVMFSGALLTLFYYRPLGEFIRYLIPLPIQVGTAVGIGLLTCLAGSTEIGLVQTGQRFNICASKSRDDSERDPLNPAAHRLPAWTHVQPQRTPRWLQFLLGDIVPNRHQALFWFGHMGPELHVALLRLHLLLRSVYIALVLAVFTPAIWAEFGFLWAMFYMAVSGFLMWWEYYFVLQDLITCMCHISCSGMLRHNPIVDEVVRKQKTKNAIRAIMMMTTLVHSDHSGAGAGLGTKGLSTHTFDMDPNSSFCASISQEEIAEIGSIYDMYDTDGSGEIDKGELEKVMESLGFALSEVELEQMFAALDKDGDGTISRDEFIRWNLKNRERNGHETDMKEKAHQMFKIFDRDGSGSIKVSELVDGLQGLKHGLTTDDLVALAHELDENGDGEISLEEFEHILHVHTTHLT